MTGFPMWLPASSLSLPNFHLNYSSLFGLLLRKGHGLCAYE